MSKLIDDLVQNLQYVNLLSTALVQIYQAQEWQNINCYWMSERSVNTYSELNKLNA